MANEEQNFSRAAIALLRGVVERSRDEARLTEIWDALEDGRGGEMAAGVEDAAVFVDALDVDAELLLEDVELVVEGVYVFYVVVVVCHFPFPFSLQNTP